ncbi:MAG TPA: response regulator transcription factor [Syntrophomonadaceae bacterium]|nr:response regulator transcription factor [Syntrophomonadaceae bacterium]HNX29257.1 response regulator transcription factor [Syntrophomonadaceae bacterium]HPR94101.1 response regulator transcription factor [Syntrophomonadaceae bacterium]
MQGKVLVVDDEESLVRLITFNLNKDGFETIQANDGNEAWSLIMSEKPDLIILDLMLPGKDGLEICRDLRRENIDTPIIMLTARDDETDKIVGLELGADDYVTKPFSVKELGARVRAILRRQNAGDNLSAEDKVIKVGEFTVKPLSYEIWLKEKKLDLTMKEYELLQMLLKNKGRVLKREYLLEVLWDYPDSANTRALDVYISKLREKIEDDAKNPRNIITIRGLGYKFEENSYE